MKIAIISNLEGAPRVEDLQGYNQVYAYFAGRELARLGCEVVYVQDRKLPDSMVQADVAIVLSAHGIVKCQKDLDVERAVTECAMLYWLSDAESRSIIPWKGSEADGAFVGMGADPDYCYSPPKSKPIILFNAWNAVVDGHSIADDPSTRIVLGALEGIVDHGVEIWGMNIKLDCAAKHVGISTGDNEEKLLYVKWHKVCEAYRAGSVFLDLTPKVIELGRVEAAACGNHIAAVPLFTVDAREGLHYLSQSVLPSNPRLLVDHLLRVIEQDHDTISKRALEYFRWEYVAQRILNYLERR